MIAVRYRSSNSMFVRIRAIHRSYTSRVLKVSSDAAPAARGTVRADQRDTDAALGASEVRLAGIVTAAEPRLRRADLQRLVTGARESVGFDEVVPHRERTEAKLDRVHRAEPNSSLRRPPGVARPEPRASQDRLPDLGEQRCRVLPGRAREDQLRMADAV